MSPVEERAQNYPRPRWRDYGTNEKGPLDGGPAFVMGKTISARSAAISRVQRSGFSVRNFWRRSASSHRRAVSASSTLGRPLAAAQSYRALRAQPRPWVNSLQFCRCSVEERAQNPPRCPWRDERHKLKGLLDGTLWCRGSACRRWHELVVDQKTIDRVLCSSIFYVRLFH